MRFATIIIASLALLLPGCVKESPAQTVADTFCISAKKRIWSIEDTPESIRAAEVWNRTVDRRCRVPGAKA